MNYAELKQRKEFIKAERDRLTAEIEALTKQKHEAEQEFLAGLAVVKVGDRVIHKGEEYEVTSYSDFVLKVAESCGDDLNTPSLVAYNCQRVLIDGGLTKKVIELTDRDFSVKVKP